MNLLILLVAALGFSAPSTRSNFSGTWNLDKKHSTNLPASFASVESYLLDIAQAPDSMTAVARMAGSGQKVTFPVAVYRFNGSEVFREDMERHIRRWVTCSWQTTGKKLVVNSRVEQQIGPIPTRYTQRDVWQMLDARTLQISITQTFEGKDSTHSERRVFKRHK
jgi:hypothetical protein